MIAYTRPAERSVRSTWLEGAPVPVAGNTGSNVGGLAQVGLEGGAA